MSGILVAEFRKVTEELIGKTLLKQKHDARLLQVARGGHVVHRLSRGPQAFHVHHQPGFYADRHPGAAAKTLYHCMPELREINPADPPCHSTACCLPAIVSFLGGRAISLPGGFENHDDRLSQQHGSTRRMNPHTHE